MALNLDAIGTTTPPRLRSWKTTDAMLYAVAVGAGGPDVTQELAFTTENSHDISQQVLPTFGVVLAGGGGAARDIGKFNPAMLVHAEQYVELAGPIPDEGSVAVTSTLVDIVDKRSGALVQTESVAVDPETGDLRFKTWSGVFIRGEGGFNPSAESSGSGPAVPERTPDHVVSEKTLPQQALLYRLCGDHNPLHSDPSFAARAGFKIPILHGLCTYGFAGRALLHLLCGSDPARFRSMYGRFSKPVFPGQTLTTQIWQDEGGGAASFRTTTDDGTVVLDRGRCTFA